MIGRTVLKNRATHVAIAVGLLAAMAQIAWSLPPDAGKSGVNKDAKNGKIANDPAFQKSLLTIASEYQSYGKVDDMSRWAPWLCAAPPPPKARISKSGDEGTHGKKVYYLFAKNRDSYMNKEPGATGQVIVKESWLPNLAEGVDPTSPAARKPVSKQDLFIMFKTDPKTPNTDEGWVYGTVTSDGKTVTSAGRVQSCMGCHTTAPHGRLFGLAE